MKVTKKSASEKEREDTTYTISPPRSELINNDILYLPHTNNLHVELPMLRQ